MAQRYLLVARPALSAQDRPLCVSMQVDDRAAIGPWIATLAARLGYPLVDAFGSPLTYRLRLVSGGLVLPTRGRFAQARFPSGSQVILEPEPYPLSAQGRPARRPDPGTRVSRRALLGVLTTSSLLGLGTGMTTALAQHLLARPVEAMGPLMVATRFGQHQQTVRALTWSSDGRMLASGGDDGVLWVWQAQGTARYRRPFAAPVRALSWSPDGTQVVAGVGNTVAFVDARTGVLLADNATQHTATITTVGWTQGPTSFALSAGTDQTAVVWSAQSHQPRLVFRRHTAAIEALSAREMAVVTASAGGLARLWNAGNGEEIHGYYAPNSRPLRAAAWSVKSMLALGGDEGVIHLWPEAGTCQQQVSAPFGEQCLDGAIGLRGHTQAVRALAFSPDGTQLASGGDDQRLIIWSMQTRKPLLIQPQPHAIAALAWSPEGSLLSGALGPQVMVWHIDL